MPFVPVSYTSNVDGAGNSTRAEATKPIAASAGTTVVKNAPGRVISAVVTAAGTSTDNATVYDNTAGSGTILAIIPGGTYTVGQQVTIDLPAAIGITVVNVASGPGFTLGYN